MIGRDTEPYAVLKQSVPVEEWPLFVQSLLTDTPGWWGKTEWLMAQEGMWTQLLALGQTKGLGHVANYSGELERRFPHEMADLYEKQIEQLLKHTSNRETYAEACKLLVRMKSIGKEQRAAEMVRSFKSRYPQRRAMIEELNQF